MTKVGLIVNPEDGKYVTLISSGMLFVPEHKTSPKPNPRIPSNLEVRSLTCHAGDPSSSPCSGTGI